jgi:hypothetical protein
MVFSLNGKGPYDDVNLDEYPAAVGAAKKTASN